MVMMMAWVILFSPKFWFKGQNNKVKKSENSLIASLLSTRFVKKNKQMKPGALLTVNLKLGS